MRIKNKFLLSGLCFSLGVFTAQVQAQTTSPQTTTFDVTITITASCDISSGANGVENLVFGSHDSFQTNVDQTTELKVTCTNGAAYNIGLSAGINPSAANDVNARRMKGESSSPNNAGDYVPYNLYSDASRATVWGETVGTNTIASTGTGAQQTYTIYGRVPSTNYTVGDYRDTVTATVTF